MSHRASKLEGQLWGSPSVQMAAFGATSSLADALSKVPSPSDLPTFVIAAPLVGRHRPVRRVAPAIGSIGAAWAMAGFGVVVRKDGCAKASKPGSRR